MSEERELPEEIGSCFKLGGQGRSFQWNVT